MAAGFRLASVLRVRKLQEDMAAARSGAAGARAADARTESLERRASLAGEEFSAHGDAHTFAAAVAARSAAAARFVEAQALAAQTLAAADAARAEWTAARQKAKALDKLAEKHSAERTIADLRAEQAALDEQAARAKGATLDLTATEEPS